MSTSSEPILAVSDLRVQFASRRGIVRAVDGISFAIRPGEALGLVGESGCGKSTALRAILGLLPPNAKASGSITFQGIDLLATPARLSEVRGRGISMVFQEPMTALNPVMKVGDQIAEAPMATGGLSRREARERGLELMRLVGIPDPSRRAESFPHELSGGLRQRVMIALALALDPKVILCDEPTTALDVTIQDQILQLLASLGDRLGLALVFVTHNLAVVAGLCQRVAVMYAGTLVETGGVEEVFSAPMHPYTIGLLESVPDFDRVRDRLNAIPGSPPDLISPPSGCRFHPRCSFAQEDCRMGEFRLQSIVAGRETACIHADSLGRPLPQGAADV